MTTTSYTIFVKFKDPAHGSLKSKRVYQDIFDKKAYAVAIIDSMTNAKFMYFPSGQNTEGYVAIPLDNIQYFSIDYWDPRLTLLPLQSCPTTPKTSRSLTNDPSR